MFLPVRLPDICILIQKGKTVIIPSIPTGKEVLIWYFRIKNMGSLAGRVEIYSTSDYNNPNIKPDLLYITTIESHQVDQIPYGFTPDYNFPIFRLVDIKQIYVESNIPVYLHMIYGLR